jgi:hypothetical protein
MKENDFVDAKMALCPGFASVAGTSISEAISRLFWWGFPR